MTVRMLRTTVDFDYFSEIFYQLQDCTTIGGRLQSASLIPIANINRTVLINHIPVPRWLSSNWIHRIFRRPLPPKSLELSITAATCGTRARVNRVNRWKTGTKMTQRYSENACTGVALKSNLMLMRRQRRVNRTYRRGSLSIVIISRWMFRSKHGKSMYTLCVSRASARQP
jgi:hypothetical protein